MDGTLQALLGPARGVARRPRRRAPPRRLRGGGGAAHGAAADGVVVNGSDGGCVHIHVGLECNVGARNAVRTLFSNRTRGSIRYAARTLRIVLQTCANQWPQLGAPATTLRGRRTRSRRGRGVRPGRPCRRSRALRGRRRRRPRSRSRGTTHGAARTHAPGRPARLISPPHSPGATRPPPTAPRPNSRDGGAGCGSRGGHRAGASRA